MKTKNILYTLFNGVLLLTLAACSKQGTLLYNANVLTVSVKGYNGDKEPLEVTVDTVQLMEFSNGAFDARQVYVFPNGQQNARLTIREKATGKVVMEKDLKKEDTPVSISFFYMDGKVSDMPELPSVEEGKLKLTYMFKPTITGYTQPVDIVLGKYYFTPKVFEEITRIKNVKPYEFTAPVTLSTFSTASQPYNGQNTSVLFLVYVYKAGTNEFYTQGSAYTFNATSSTAPKPASSAAASKLYIFSELPSGSVMRFNKDLEL
ncbi:hypothetical protein HNQ91_000621 [Filimonas zeae]|uniref:DUF4249 domain-containing protein n=1 Tax=Filimonas zeae TaxID=1737353 RepID=A0A917MTC0_9BACT|nr:hypothetical protein [Filimonas zeae]MDR6337599.1 hypothetical protein [Filimonas zeae]GGH59390.1 hypothetical protein GCM10011379_06110 [Filimonas zeae]